MRALHETCWGACALVISSWSLVVAAQPANESQLGSAASAEAAAAPEPAPEPEAAPEADAAADPAPAPEPDAAPAPGDTAAPVSTNVEDGPMPVTTTVTQPDASGEVSVSDADLDSFLDAAQVEEALDTGPSLRIYGFADFTVAREFNAGEGGDAYSGPGANFYIGNLNVYLDADLTHGIRSLAEIRFSYLPNGSSNGITPDRISTRALDYADDLRPVTWGGIEIERAWVEYAAHGLFAIRAGQYLTPYGIWNVDHATPTIIPTLRPYVVGEALLPERQTGFQVYGSHTQGMATLGYHLTLSNGRGNLSSYTDLDKNKAVGGRLWVALTGALGELKLGLSGYVGRRTDGDLTIVGTNLAPTIDVQWDEVSYAGDLLWKWKGLHFQFEAIGSDIRFTDEGRYVPTYGAPANSRLADYRRWGLYGLLGYRTPWVGLMPYTMVSVFRPGAPAPTDVSPSYFNSVDYSVGLNMRPIAALALKVQYTLTRSDAQVDARFLDAPDTGHSLAGQIAWSF